jgi:FkbM family methyltransferase
VSGPGLDRRQRLLASILRACARTNLRGRTRLTMWLGRQLEFLQSVPIEVGDWPPIYMDLRSVGAHSWFIGTPFESSPLEVSEQAVMRRLVRPGDVVFDIGANLGVHTVMLARAVGPHGRVVAFEPNAEILPLLERTLQALPNVVLQPCALSDERKESTLFVPPDDTMASLADWTSGERTGGDRRSGAARAHAVRCQERRLDELIESEGIPAPDFVKCDVEGAELLVFKGGRVTLDRPDAPIILFETNAATTGGFHLERSAAAEFLARLPQPGYRFLEVHGGGALRPTDASRGKVPNMLAVPRAKSGLCPELDATGPSPGTA